MDAGLEGSLQDLSVIDSHLVEVEGDTLSLYGSGALESLDRNWSMQTAGMVTTVAFTFIEFDEIVQVLPKLKMKFPNSLVSISLYFLKYSQSEHDPCAQAKRLFQLAGEQAFG